MATPAEPLSTLSAALSAPADSREQAELLATLRASLEAHPAPIQVLCTTLVPLVANAHDSLLRRWVLELLNFAICRSTLTMEDKTKRSCIRVLLVRTFRSHDASCFHGK
jgi:symplekin